MLTPNRLMVSRIYFDHKPPEGAVDVVTGVVSLSDIRALYAETIQRKGDFELVVLPEDDGSLRDPRCEAVATALDDPTHCVVCLRQPVNSFPELAAKLHEAPATRPLVERLRGVYHIRVKPVKSSTPTQMQGDCCA